METVIAILSALVPLAGVTTSLVLSIRKNKKDKVLFKEEKMINFYTNAAINLVMSAERLELTGPEKKNYVMVWLENEAIKANIEVNYHLMSLTIEKAIILMNDHRHLDRPIPELIEKTVQDHMQDAQDRLDAEHLKALGALDTVIDISNKGIKEAEKYIDKQRKDL